MSNFLKDIIKETGNEYASLVSDGASGDVDSFIDTGSYIFNALLGGSIHRGLPSNKITAIAGESATGKTFFVLGMCKHFLDKNPDAGVIFFESLSVFGLFRNAFNPPLFGRFNTVNELIDNLL